jgi:hypothetical protein
MTLHANGERRVCRGGDHPSSRFFDAGIAPRRPRPCAASQERRRYGLSVTVLP